MGTSRNGVLFAVAIAGFALVCCVNIACFFPGVFMPEASAEAYRVFNLSLGLCECVGAVAYGLLPMRFGERSVVMLTALGYAFFAAGCVIVLAAGEISSPVLAAGVGVLCGLGLAFTMLFWFSTLTFFPTNRAAYVQGWQALIGALLFFVAFIALPTCAAGLALAMAVVSAVLAWGFVRGLATLQERRPAQERDRFAYSAPEAGLGAYARKLVRACAFPLFAFVLASFLYGAVESVAFLPEGSPYGLLASILGCPVGAAGFLAWQRLSGKHDYGFAVKVIFAALAVLLLVAPFDGVAFFVSACYQLSGLMAYSQIIERLRERRVLALASIALLFTASHVLYVAGLYMPGFFGVGSHIAFMQSTSFLLFFIYLVLAVLLFVDRRQHKDEVEEMANALVEQREREEELKRQKAADEAAEYQALCQEIGEEAGLTKREVEVLALLARGRDLPYICEELYLARNTVKGYTKSIYAKLGVHSKQELIDLVDARVG